MAYYHLDAFEVAISLISHSDPDGLWCEITDGEYWLTEYQVS